MSNFKIQFGNDVRRKSAPADLTYDGLKDIIIRTYVKPESLSPDFDYKFQLAYEDGDDFVTISDTEDLQLAFSHFKGDVLKIVVVGAKKIDVKAKAFKEAFQTGLQLLEEGAAEAAIPHFVEALRLRKEASCAYNLACAFARLNKSSEALLWLRTALQLGYVNFAWAIRDPDLANIRDTDEFLALVRQMRANSLPPFFRQFSCRTSPSATRNPTSTPTPTSSPTSSPTPSRTASPARSASPLSAKAPEFVPASTEPTVAPVPTMPTPSAPLEEEAAAAAAATPDPKQADALAQLAAMGFIDPEANRLLLEQNGGDVVKTVHQLLFA